MYFFPDDSDFEAYGLQPHRKHIV